MSTRSSDDIPPLHGPLDSLERALIEDFIRMRGHDPRNLAQLTGPQRQALMSEASSYASARLTEVESRSRYVHDLHQGVPVRKKG